jgi:hypothetical protein
MEELERINLGVGMPSELAPGTSVNLKSDEFDNGTGVLPYDRMMELMAGGPGMENGSLRSQVEAMMKSAEWKDLSDPTKITPGAGTKNKVVRRLIEGQRSLAFVQVLEEYPLLRAAWEDFFAQKGAALERGPEGLEQTLEEQGR